MLALRMTVIVALAGIFCAASLSRAAERQIGSGSEKTGVTPARARLAQRTAPAPETSPPEPRTVRPPAVEEPLPPPSDTFDLLEDGALEDVSRADRTTPLPPTRRTAWRSPIVSLASVPNMFGDFFNQGGQILTVGNYSALADIPTAGGARRAKISENNKALPMDRVFFVYNHFHNALDVNPDQYIPGLGRSISVDRYTVGLEKIILDGRWSVELRMPFVSEYALNSPWFDIQATQVGNLAVTFKRLLYSNETTAVAAGLGIDTPTGGNVVGKMSGIDYTLHNDAVHLSPFVGFLTKTNDSLFWQGFLQLDVAANGNRVNYVLAGTPGTFGTLSEQTLMHIDLSAGYWLYRNRRAGLVTGLAPLVEFHYTTTLNDAQVIGASVAGESFFFGNLLNRVDVAQVTVGMHAEVANRTTVRLGGVFPLENDADKPFDAEVQVSINRRF